MKNIALCILIVMIPGQADAQETAEADTGGRSASFVLWNGLFVNSVFHVTSRIFGADFAQTNLESIKTNLKSRWVWDNDGFLFNHPGHPYQGGLYHTSARANGFGFYESTLFDAAGSVMWELFGETDIPSVNDLIVTTIGGAAFGEMLHLLYREIRTPWAILVSPMDALINTIQRENPPHTQNLYYLSTMTGPAWIRTIKTDRDQLRQLRNDNAKITPAHVYTGNIACEVIYGDPFIRSSKKPYSHFEIRMQLGSSFYPFWLDWTILTDAYLVSFNPVNTQTDLLSTGLSMHYDLIAGSNINFASNALDWSLKWRHDFENTKIEIKGHLGCTLFGSSEYYPFAEITSVGFQAHEPENNYGTGGNLKLYATLHNNRYGKVTLGICGYLLYIIPWNGPESEGLDFVSLSFLEYSLSLTDSFSVFISSSFYLRAETSRRMSNIAALANRVILGAQWKFLDRG
jgi:hypothetical protein